ncbi:MAG TPA: mechanosensitive ion channel domain-containing protein [Methanomassiliicoccales archaeon]|nr:mechanosensitive ion channel domain-containing protein [Methanomassiliicoccales archaeon]
MKRTRLAGPLVGVMLVIMLAFPLLSCTASATVPVNIFNVDDYDKHVVAGQGATFDWVVYNNDSTPYLVQMNTSRSVSEGINEAFNSPFLMLAANQSTTVVLRVTTEKSMPTTANTFTIDFTITKMSDPSQSVVVTKTAVLQVTAAVGSSAGQNKLFGIWDNFLPSPLDTNVGAFVVTLLGWVGIALFFAFVIDPLVHALTKKTETELDDIILKIIRAPVFVFVITYGLVSSLEILNLDRDLVLNIEFAYRIIVVVLIVWVSYKVYDGVVLHYARRYAEKTETEIDDVVVPLMEKIGLIIIPLLGLMVILGMLGYDLTALLAGVGFLGIVIGFAAQSTLANFFAGIQLLTDRPFKVGDLLRIDGGAECEVRKIGMRATELYNPDTDEVVVIPNNDIANKMIVNMVEPGRNLKIMVKIETAYGSDVDKVMTILKQAAMETSNVINEPSRQPVIRFSDFGESSLIFKVFIIIDDVNNRFKVASDFRKEVNRRFAEEGIEIPFPQRVVHIVDETKNADKA